MSGNIPLEKLVLDEPELRLTEIADRVLTHGLKPPSQRNLGEHRAFLEQLQELRADAGGGIEGTGVQPPSYRDVVPMLDRPPPYMPQDPMLLQAQMN